MGYLYVGLAFFVIAKVYADSNDDMMSCLELFNPETDDKMCCETFETFDNIDNNSKDCFKEDSEDWQCEDFQCILRKSGMLKDDKIDEDGAKKYFDQLEKDSPKDKSILDRVRSQCLDGKYQTYPPDDVCPAVKFYVCVYINVSLECKSWKTDETCAKMAENAKKCRSALEN